MTDPVDAYRELVVRMVPNLIAAEHLNETEYRFYCMFLVNGALDGWPRLMPEVLLGEVSKLAHCDRRGLKELRWHPLEPPGAHWAPFRDERGRGWAMGTVAVHLGSSPRAMRIIEAAEQADPGEELLVDIARELNGIDWASSLNVEGPFPVVPWMPGWQPYPRLDILRDEQIELLRERGWID